MATSQAQRLRHMHSRAKSPEIRHLVRKEIHTVYKQTCLKPNTRKNAPQKYTFHWSDLVLMAAVSVVIVAAIYRAISASTGHPSIGWLVTAIIGTAVALCVGIRIFRKEGWLSRKS